MLGGRDIKVTNGQLARFLHFVQECCPWVPEERKCLFADVE